MQERRRDQLRPAKIVHTEKNNKIIKIENFFTVRTLRQMQQQMFALRINTYLRESWMDEQLYKMFENGKKCKKLFLFSFFSFKDWRIISITRWHKVA